MNFLSTKVVFYGGARVVVSSSSRDAILIELHEGHSGMARMKALARMYVWWPGIVDDIEKTVRQCIECQYPPTDTTCGSLAALEMANTLLGKAPFGLRWSRQRENVLDHH